MTTEHTDRELLELAARAYGIAASYIPGVGMVYADHETGEIVTWNPREDIGDAFRLAVKLKINLVFTNYAVIAGDRLQATPYNINAPCGTTCLAIVRAAAEIGKAMGEDK